MQNSKNKPAIRFKGFTDAWEQRPLEEIAAFLKGIGYTKSDLRNKGTPIILYGRLYIDYSFLIDRVDTFCFPKKGSVITQGNEVIVPASGETAVDIARAAAVSQAGVILAGDLNIIRPRDPLVPSFLALLLSHGNTHRDLAKRAQGKSVVHLRNSDIKKTLISFPGREEQNYVVDTFRCLERLITLHQRKHEKLLKLKNALLERMFPANGKNFPKIRFLGFTDAWEYRKLRDIGSAYSGLTGKTREDFGHGSAKFITYMNVFSNPTCSQELQDPIEVDSRQNEVEIGDAFFTISSETPEEVGMSSVLLEKTGITYLNSFCFGFRPIEKLDNFFLAHMLRSKGARKQIVRLAQGISRYNISKNKMLEIDIFFPGPREQKQIGEICCHLDKLLSLHQRKLKTLQNIKNALLEKMFV